MTDLIEVKTADLQGWQLAWAVAIAEELDPYLVGPHYGKTERRSARRQSATTCAIAKSQASGLEISGTWTGLHTSDSPGTT